MDKMILGGENKMSKKTKNAVSYLAKKGVPVVLMTGHSFSYAKKAIRSLKLEGVVVAHSGAFISDTEQNEWFNRPLSMDTALDLCHILERFDCEVRLMYKDHSVTQRPIQKQTLLARMSLSAPGEQIIYPTTYVDSLYEQVLKEGTGPLNVLLKCEEQADMDHIRSVLKQELEEVELTSNENASCMIVGSGAGRTRALQWLINQRGLEMDQVVYIGVDDEDIELVEMVGLGVAMGNGSDDLQAAADWVTRTIEQDGFAYMVHEVFRKQLRVQVEK